MNNQTQEALKILWDAVERHRWAVSHDAQQSSWQSVCEAHDEAKQALEQPAQEPVAIPKFPTMLRKMWSGTEVQEWIDKNTHPHQWQGLTDDEIHNIADYSFPFPSEMFAEIFAFARAIEAKLKEKNT